MKTSEQILAVLNKKGYKFEYKTMYEHSFEIVKKDDPNDLLCRFAFQCKQVPFCCGMLELGAFRYTVDHKGIISKEELMVLIAPHVKKFFESKSFKNKKNYQLFIYNLIDERGCDFMKKFIHIHFPRQFKRVATYYNTIHADHEIQTYIQKP